MGSRVSHAADFRPQSVLPDSVPVPHMSKKSLCLRNLRFL